MSVLAPAYRPRRPTESVPYEVVREHLETFLEHARETYEAPLPRYVEQDLRGYLRCGVFAHGFVRCHCEACGHDLLVAFSCKSRGVCPSCAGRRMANTAAHLVDRVLPAVPVRQWVLSLPFEVRSLAAFRADVLSAFARAFVEGVFARYRAQARGSGHRGPLPCGAVTFVQRFGSSLNLNVHFHVVVLDGVFLTEDAPRLRFEPAAAPTRAELEAVARRVHKRITAWLDRRCRSRAGTRAAAPAASSVTPSLEACAAIAMARGEVRTLRDEASHEEGAEPAIEPPRPNGAAVECDGFNVEASVFIPADDDLGRERLCRYGARPPFALDRLRRLPGGRVAYRVKKLRDGRAKQRIMTPLEFLARLAALVPPPRYPLVRYHGVLAPHSPWRKSVVPRPPAPAPCTRKETATPAPRSGEAPRAQAHSARADCTSKARPAKSDRPGAPRAAPDAPARHDPARSEHRGPSVRAPTAAEALTPNVLSVSHWSRLFDGHLYARSPRLDWARLLRRTFEVDVLKCPRCERRLRIVGEVTDPQIVRFVLDRLALPADTPTAARARDPTDLLGHGDVQ